MYDFNVVSVGRNNPETGEPVFQIEVKIPRLPRVISGMEIDVVPLTHIFSEQDVISGNWGDLTFKNDAEKNKFTKQVGQALFASKGSRLVVAHS